ERKQSVTDQRKVMVNLTAKGKKLQELAADIPLRLMQKMQIEPTESKLEEFIVLKSQLNDLIKLLKEVR
ncbi:MAG TPA: hypothetical protein P5084_14175, partial [Paludibacter sp.]|nr:hypothetical protein [Paludibacter sp.]